MSLDSSSKTFLSEKMRPALLWVVERILRVTGAGAPGSAPGTASPPPQNHVYKQVRDELVKHEMRDYQGNLELCNARTVAGWAWDRYRPDEPVRVEIWDGDTLIDAVTARRYRLDLFCAGIGNGRHGFLYSLPARIRDRERHQIRVRIVDAQGPPLELRNSPAWTEPCGPEPFRLSDGPRRRLNAALQKEDVYARAKVVTDLGECFFYHTMHIPGYGIVPGPWDLRRTASNYLGGVDFEGKRVLEVGTASGFLCFFMESLGAEVVAYDLSEAAHWDVVPYAGWNYQQELKNSREHIRRLNNGYWLAYRALQSQARVVYGSVYDVPNDIGLVDVAVVSSVLLHLRDPFLALWNAAKLAVETLVIVDRVPNEDPLLLKEPYMRFLPEASLVDPTETWWVLSPELLKKFLAVLGFDDVEITYHSHNWKGAQIPLFTLVGRRTRPLPLLSEFNIDEKEPPVPMAQSSPVTEDRAAVMLSV